MKFPKLFLILGLSMSLLASHPSKAKEGTGVKGGVLVQVNGQWVPLEEALSYESATFAGFSRLPDGNPNAAIRQVFNKPYKLYLSEWIVALKKISPDFGAAVDQSKEIPIFKYVDHPLALNPSDLPQSPVDYKSYRKAALYVPGKTGKSPGTIWVSIPVMEEIGSIGDRRLTVQQNQGFLLLHELFHVALPEQSADEKEKLGEQVIHARIEGSSPEEFGLGLSRAGGRFLTSPVTSWDSRLAVLNLANTQGVLGQVNLEGLDISVSDLDRMNGAHKIGAEPSSSLKDRFAGQKQFRRLYSELKPQQNRDYLNRLLADTAEQIGRKVGSDGIAEGMRSWWIPSFQDYVSIRSNPVSEAIPEVSKATAELVVEACAKANQESNCRNVFGFQIPELSWGKHVFRLIYSPRGGETNGKLPAFAEVEVQLRKYAKGVRNGNWISYPTKYDVKARGYDGRNWIEIPSHEILAYSGDQETVSFLAPYYAFSYQPEEK